MKKILHPALGGALGMIGLVACDAAPPPKPVTSPEAEIRPLTTVGAFAEVVRLRDPYLRALRLGALLPVLDPEAVPEVQKTLRDHTLDFGATELELLLRFWATHEPEEATLWAASRSPQFFRIPAMLSALTVWAEADPRAAMAAAEEWADRTDIRDVIQVALVRGWYQADPVELERFIYSIGMGFARQRALVTYIRALIQEEGPEALMRWAESIPEDDETYKLSVYRQVASALPLFDSEAALRWCEAHCDGPFGKDLRSLIGRRWAIVDGPAALAWLSTAPEGHDRNLAVRIAFALWVQHEREQALGWMAEQTSGEVAPWLRSAIPVYAKTLAVDSPHEALAWVEQIEDESDRGEVLIQVLRIWRKHDQAAAEAWLAESPLTEEDRQRVRAKRLGLPGTAS